MKANQHIKDNVLSVAAGQSLALMLDDSAPQVLEVLVGQDARLDLVVLYDSSCDVRHSIALQKNSVLNLCYIALSGDEMAQKVQVDLLGENAECSVCGFTVSSLTQKRRTSVLLNHAKPNCHSVQLFKQIACDTSSIDFSGRVLVAKDAQHTDAQQTSRTLLLSREAHVHAEPQLEIYADDVKCSHGATVGQLDAEALFYLRSRGISLAEAQQLLLLGFADEVIQKIEDKNLQEKVAEKVSEILKSLL